MSTKIFDTLSPAGRRHISACSSVIMEPHNSLIASKICSTTGRPVSNIYYETSSKQPPNLLCKSQIYYLCGYDIGY